MSAPKSIQSIPRRHRPHPADDLAALPQTCLHIHVGYVANILWQKPVVYSSMCMMADAGYLAIGAMIAGGVPRSLGARKSQPPPPSAGVAGELGDGDCDSVGGYPVVGSVSRPSVLL